ncbi:MAG: purine-nucleoside phosphorylase [Clostridia bacterium]|nr:purine-nucleoside phosphorylase [Clostridia bacterium]
MIQKLSKAAEFILGKIGTRPEIALILGTGLGSFAELLEDATTVPYSEIPGFPVSTAPYHKGQLVSGRLGKKQIVVMQGRVHYYEGYSMHEVAFPVWVLKLLGVKTLFVTNAVGAINLAYHVGTLMMISDHIKFFNDTPLRGENIDEFGPRFFDMSKAYTPGLRALAREKAKELSIPLEEGVYAYMSGPNYETPAEIRMLKALGADVVGMSTVPEVLAAVHSGMDVFGLSFCVNMAAGIEKEIKHLGFSEVAINHFKALVSAMIAEI